MTQANDTPTGPWTRPPIGVLACVVAVLVLLAAVLLSERAAAALSQPPAPHSPQVLRPVEDEPEEDESEAEEPEEESEEEGEEEGETGTSEPGVPQRVPERCLDYTDAARMVVSPAHKTARLEVNYESDESGRAGVSYWSEGRKGTAKLGESHWRLSRWGHVERTAHLSRRESAKVAAARSFSVQVEMPDTPAYCEIYCTRHLTLSHRSGGRTVWTEAPGDARAATRPRLQR